MICKAGHVTKRAVGSIRIQDTDTLFEIAGDKADAFAAAVAENGSGENGVTIQMFEGKPAPDGERRAGRPPRKFAAPGGKRKFEQRSASMKAAAAAEGEQ